MGHVHRDVYTCIAIRCLFLFLQRPIPFPFLSMRDLNKRGSMLLKFYGACNSDPVGILSFPLEMMLS